MSSCIPGTLPDEEVLNHGDRFDLLLGIPPQSPDRPNGDNFHACLIRGSLVPQRLQSAVEALQERHPRMQACFYANPWTGYNYLRKCKEKIPLDIRIGSARTINVDLENELRVHIDSARGPFCRIAYVQHPEEGTGLLIFHQNHGVGDGRCCEIVLSHLLKLYDGQHVPYFSNVKNLTQMRTVSQQRLTKWHHIEAQMPRQGPNVVAQTFVDVKHPAFSSKFEGICIEIARLDANDTQRLLQACRKNKGTVTSAVAAAVTYAVMAELLERRRTSEFITIGMTMNERGRSLGPEFDEEAGNLVADMHINCEPKANFWEVAEAIARLYNMVLDDDCAHEATMANFDIFHHRESMLLALKATPDHLANLTGGLEHTNMASFGVLKRYGKYKDFEVIENYALSHALYLGTKVNVCTSGSSGRFTASVMATRNVVPNARELACKLRDHIQAVLNGVLAEEGGPENTHIHRWCSDVAVAMEHSIAKRRAELALAPKGNDGRVFQGNVRGNFNSISHFKLVVNLLCTLIAGGGLSGFPIYVKEMKKAGVFNYVCGPGVQTCDDQAAALSNLYQFSQSAQFALGIFIGYAFDILGARWGAVAGAAIACCSMFLLGCLICLDAHVYPITQTVMMYTCYILGDCGDLLVSFSLLGWMWHYPGCQALIIGLQNGAYQGSSMFGIIFVWMTAADIPLYQGFWLIAFTNMLAAFGVYKCTPTKQEFFHEASKVLDRHAAGLDPAIFAGWLHLKSQLKSLWGVIKLFPLDNFLFWMIWPLGAAGTFWWQGGFAAIFDKWFDDEDSEGLLNFFVVVYSPIGICLNPLAGFLLDWIGMAPYMFIASLVMITQAITLNIHNVIAQKVFILAMSCGMGLVQNCQQKWIAMFGPPELFGTWMGLSLTWIGCGMVFLITFLGADSTIPAAGLFFCCALFQVATVAVLMAKGVPKHPPKNMYDSPDFLRGKKVNQ